VDTLRCERVFRLTSPGSGSNVSSHPQDAREATELFLLTNFPSRIITTRRVAAVGVVLGAVGRLSDRTGCGRVGVSRSCLLIIISVMSTSGCGSADISVQKVTKRSRSEEAERWVAGPAPGGAVLDSNGSGVYKNNQAPPSSSGLGHSPLKAKTGVRVPLGVIRYLARTCNRSQPLAQPRATRGVVSFLANSCQTLRQVAGPRFTEVVQRFCSALKSASVTRRSCLTAISCVLPMRAQTAWIGWSAASSASRLACKPANSGSIAS
jgi:hypothetical protein